MRALLAFLGFWYDFIVGDDPLVAAGVVTALAMTALLAHAGLPAWWLMPATVLTLLAGSLARATRRR